MHYLMLVTLAMHDGATSLGARNQAMELLLADDSFCGEGGRFGTPLCDWFVIGGRWSGMLTKNLLGETYQAAFREEFPELAADWISSSLAEKHHDRLNQFWQRFGGTGDHPYNRNSYDDLGSDDDAMFVNQALYDHFLAQDPTRFCESFADLDDEPVDETFIGRKWLIVVDYHN